MDEKREEKESGGKLWEYGRKERGGREDADIGWDTKGCLEEGYFGCIRLIFTPSSLSPPPHTHTSRIDRFESESSKNSNTTDTLGHKGSIGDRKRREMRLGEEDSELFSFLLSAQHTMLYTSPFLLLLFLSHARTHVPADREV